MRQSRRSRRQRHGIFIINMLMTIGLYNEPQGAYLPSILF